MGRGGGGGAKFKSGVQEGPVHRWHWRGGPKEVRWWARVCPGHGFTQQGGQ